MNDNDELTVADAARYLHYSSGHLRNMRSANRGPKSVRGKGGRVMYTRRDLDAWLTLREQQTTRGGVS